MRPYTAALTARREGNGDSVLRIVPAFVLASSDDEAQAQGTCAAQEVFPEADGWTAHHATCAAVPLGLVLGGYRVRWQIEQVDR
jgi:hypothetical protein